jgi:hypothetical protein
VKLTTWTPNVRSSVFKVQVPEYVMVAALRTDPPGENSTEAVVEVPGTIDRPSEKSVFGAVAPSTVPSRGLDFVIVNAEPPLLVRRSWIVC